MPAGDVSREGDAGEQKPDEVAARDLLGEATRSPPSRQMSHMTGTASPSR